MARQMMFDKYHCTACGDENPLNFYPYCRTRCKICSREHTKKKRSNFRTIAERKQQRLYSQEHYKKNVRRYRLHAIIRYYKRRLADGDEDAAVLVETYCKLAAGLTSLPMICDGCGKTDNPQYLKPHYNSTEQQDEVAKWYCPKCLRALRRAKRQQIVDELKTTGVVTAQLKARAKTIKYRRPKWLRDILGYSVDDTSDKR